MKRALTRHENRNKIFSKNRKKFSRKPAFQSRNVAKVKTGCLLRPSARKLEAGASDDDEQNLHMGVGRLIIKEIELYKFCYLTGL